MWFVPIAIVYVRLENPPLSNSPAFVILPYSQYDFDMYSYHLNITSTKNNFCLR